MVETMDVVKWIREARVKEEDNFLMVRIFFKSFKLFKYIYEIYIIYVLHMCMYIYTHTYLYTYVSISLPLYKSYHGPYIITTKVSRPTSSLTEMLHQDLNVLGRLF